MDKEFLEWQFENVNQLCTRAKQLLFFNMAQCKNDKIAFFDVYEINDDILNLTPIEQILYISIKLYELEQKNFSLAYIDYQYPIYCNNKNYKADFFIDTITICEWDKNHQSKIPTDVELIKPIVIECDGYNFHNSKQQMNNDYERENNLKIAGYDLIRFTGSQIYNDPMGCAKTIYDYVDNIIQNKQYKLGGDNE